MIRKIARRVKPHLLALAVRARFILGYAKLSIVRGLFFLTSSKLTNQANISRSHSLQFANGLRTGSPVLISRIWAIFSRKNLLVVLLGAEPEQNDAGTAAWIRLIHRATGAKFILTNPGLSFRGQNQKFFDKHVEFLELGVTSLEAVRRKVQRDYKNFDVCFFERSQPFINPIELINLWHAAHKYEHRRTLGVIVPRVTDGTKQMLGWDYGYLSQRWLPNDSNLNSYDQLSIPRYLLAAPIHGALVTRQFISSVDLPLDNSETSSLDSQFTHWILNGWRVNQRTLGFGPIQIKVSGIISSEPSAGLSEDFRNREIRNSRGQVRVIFVLPATSISGGIRAVFEMASGLAKRDFDVEIWALQGQPTWTDVPLKVQKFPDYEAIISALSGEQAVKVATWWETANPVWLSSVNKGIPVQYAQEFETWFYPTDRVAQSAVVSCYRREFSYITIASYTQHELAEVQVDATLIPSAYNEEIFRARPEIERQQNTVLALGRSFFQKNFQMTLSAWKNLGVSRPSLWLFGFEPNIVQDDRVKYHFKPSDEEAAKLYNAATVFVQTSLHEGFCLPVLEAMASGCPVITTNSHGNMDFCEDQVNCVIVEQNDVVGLSHALTQLLEDDQKRARLSEAGLKTAENYRWGVVLNQTEKYLLKLGR